MDLSIIIVSWNVKEILKENLYSIFQSKGFDSFEVFVVDNNSSDGSVEMIRKNFNKVKLIENDSNVGFSKANNQAIKKSRGRYILLLNPDMKVEKNTFSDMIQWMDKNKDVGVGGCHLIDELGESIPHIRRFPTVWDQLLIVLKVPHIFPRILNGYLQKGFDYSKEKNVDSIRGSFFMIRREVIEKIGGLDERYFVWFEEVDYCKQVWSAGWKIKYTPVVNCIDRVGCSFRQLKRGVAQKYFRDSMLKYFKKWHPAWQYYLLKVFWLVGYFIGLLGDLLSIKRRSNT